MNRIERQLDKLKLNNEKAFITYITAGLPDMNLTKKIVLLLAALFIIRIV